MLNKLSFLFITLIAITTLLIGIYVAVNNSYEFIALYNYTLGPLGDQLYDAYRVVYPVFTRQESWTQIFIPFADHRVILERVIMLYDMAVNHGIESAHPYRVIMTFWAAFFVFAFAICRNKNIAHLEKLIILGVAASLFLAHISIANFSTAILFTWPMIILFSFLSFLFLAYYIEAIHHHRYKSSYIYLACVVLFTTLTILSFNIGLWLWPIILLVLYQRRALKPNIFMWLIVIAVTYYLYLYGGWHPGITADDHGMIKSLYNPIHPFLYFSRTVSIPFVKDAPSSASFAAVMVGLLTTISSLYFLYRYWRLRSWSISDTFLFCTLFFSFSTIYIVAVMRSWINAEYAIAGGRFVAISFVMWTSLLTSYFRFFGTRVFSIAHFRYLFIVCAIAIFHYAGFIIHSSFDYSLSINKHFIAFSTGIPINKAFIDFSKNYNNEEDIQHHQYADNIQKQYGLGAYSLWPAKRIGKNIDLAMAKNCNLTGKNMLNTDLRKSGNPAVIIQSWLPGVKPNKKTFIIYTTKNNKIVGYALPIADVQRTIKSLITKEPTSSKWEGAINTDLTKGRLVKSWFVDTHAKTACEYGSLRL